MLFYIAVAKQFVIVFTLFSTWSPVRWLVGSAATFKGAISLVEPGMLNEQLEKVPKFVSQVDLLDVIQVKRSALLRRTWRIITTLKLAGLMIPVSSSLRMVMYVAR